jgi:hypothetical protein
VNPGSQGEPSAVQDAYAGLRDVLLRLRREVGEAGSADQAVHALEAQAADPESLRTAVSRAGVATDAQVLAAAQRVLQATDPAGLGSGRT